MTTPTEDEARAAEPLASILDDAYHEWQWTPARNNQTFGEFAAFYLARRQAVSTPEPVRHISDKRASGMETTDEDEREALARLIDPEAWRNVEPHSTAFYDDEAAQKTYEGFFWEGVATRRKPSLDAADRILAAGFRRQAVTTPEDPWCRDESCEHRHWRSGSMPTHKRGADCPPVPTEGEA